MTCKKETQHHCQVPKLMVSGSVASNGTIIHIVVVLELQLEDLIVEEYDDLSVVDVSIENNRMTLDNCIVDP